RREPDHVDPQLFERILKALARLIRGVCHGVIIPFPWRSLTRARETFGSFGHYSRSGHSDAMIAPGSRARRLSRRRGLPEFGRLPPTVPPLFTGRPPRCHGRASLAP